MHESLNLMRYEALNLNKDKVASTSEVIVPVASTIIDLKLFRFIFVRNIDTEAIEMILFQYVNS